MHLRKLSAGLLLIAGLLTVCQPAHADNWPRFRGPNGTGISADKDIPVEWTKDNILWKTPLPGAGNSSPIVWGDKVFVQTADKTSRQLVCLNVADGKIVWAKSLPGSTAKIHNRNSLASGTPATDGERVYVAMWDGKDLHLVAFDFKGTQLWERNLGEFTSQHGAGHSPIVYDDKVILSNDQDGLSTLIAVNAKTGKDVWSVKRQAFRSCYSTPFLLGKSPDAVEVIVTSTAGVASYNIKDGTENWHYTWSFGEKEPLRTVSSSVYANGVVIATSGNGAGDRVAIAVKAGGKGDITKGGLAWENKRDFPYVPSPLANGDFFFCVTDKGSALCFKALTGELVWEKRLGPGISASPVLIDGKIYAVAEDGSVFVIAAEPTYKLLAKNSLGEDVMASPAVADNRLFIRSKTSLFCIGKAPAK